MRCAAYGMVELRDGSAKTNGIRCENDAAYWLQDDMGEKDPLGYVCGHCAQKIIAEYREKLGQEWIAREIEEVLNE